MMAVGEDFLSQKVKEFPNNTGTIMGFHAPQHNSQYHLHMHLIILPYSHKKYATTHGTGLKNPLPILQTLEKQLLESQKES
mmetsp:Transcript_11941/g.8717  ORF Transcript_11941/g.8717 Transcript_11941/m.8717 type:complete len:81 (-) Transcript_11941:36-278(-)